MSEINVNCKGGVKIESKRKGKNLGTAVDQDTCMSGKTMAISVILKNVHFILAFLFRKSGFLKFKDRKLLCSAFLQSDFDNAFNVYYRAIENSLNIKLQTAPKINC